MLLNVSIDPYHKFDLEIYFFAEGMRTSAVLRTQQVKLTLTVQYVYNLESEQFLDLLYELYVYYPSRI
jgi:hypothetical protein